MWLTEYSICLAGTGPWFNSPEHSPALTKTNINSYPNHLIMHFCVSVYLLVWFFETGSCYIAQTGFEFMAIPLPQYPKWWDNRNELSHPASNSIRILKLCQDISTLASAYLFIPSGVILFCLFSKLWYTGSFHCLDRELCGRDYPSVLAQWWSLST